MAEPLLAGQLVRIGASTDAAPAVLSKDVVNYLIDASRRSSATDDTRLQFLESQTRQLQAGFNSSLEYLRQVNSVIDVVVNGERLEVPPQVVLSTFTSLQPVALRESAQMLPRPAWTRLGEASDARVAPPPPPPMPVLQPQSVPQPDDAREEGQPPLGLWIFVAFVVLIMFLVIIQVNH